MKYSTIFYPTKISLQVVLLLAILLFSLMPATSIVYATAANDTAATATIVSTSLPYTDTVNTTLADNVGDGPAIPSTQLCDGHYLNKGLKNVWYKYVADTTKQITIDTLGSTAPPPPPVISSYDTYLAIWKGTDPNNLTFVACDDETDVTLQSQLTIQVTAGITYYIEAAQWNNYVGSGLYETPSGGTLKLNVSEITFTDVNIGVTNSGHYKIPPKTPQLGTYAGFSGGPVQVTNLSSVPVVTSLRLLYLNAQNKNTYSELMGVPTSQLSNDYWLPYYKMNTTDTDTQVRFTNTSSTLSTTVNIYLGNNATPIYTKTLTPSSADRVTFSGMTGGPLHIVGTPGVNILAGMRVVYGSGTSFDELMAYPTAQLSTEYWFPFYNHNNANLDSELRIANTSSTDTAQVDIYFGSTKMNTSGPIAIAPLSVSLQTYAGQSGGPVRVVSTNVTPVNLVTSLRLLYLNALNKKTYSELMGVPTSQLSNDYWLPYYINNTTNTDSQVRFTNTSSTLSTTVKIYIGTNSTPVYIKDLAPSTADRVNFTNTTGGPVHIVGTPGVNILAGMRVIYGGGMSFDELMAYPTALLSPTYWFPFYNHNNVNLNTEVRIGMP